MCMYVIICNTYIYDIMYIINNIYVCYLYYNMRNVRLIH